MSFLNPIFLLALAAVSVPLLIHILSRRKVPVVPFSTLRFISSSSRRSMKRISFRRLLLLALRMLAVGLVALAFARPVVRSGLAALFPADAPRDVCVLVDRSYSMRFEGKDGNIFSRAKARAMDVLGQMDGKDELYFLAFSGKPELIYSGMFEEKGASKAVEALAGPSWGISDLSKAFRSAKGLLALGKEEAKELFVVSDFQRGLKLAPEDSMTLRSKEDTASSFSNGKGALEGRNRSAMRVFFLPIQAENPSQVAITRVDVPSVRLHRGEIVKLGIHIENFSAGSELTFPIEVLLNGERILERAVSVCSGEEKVVEVEFPVYKTGWLRGVVRKKKDKLEADDTRYFVLRVQEKVRALLVSDRDWFYLSKAISPDGMEGDIELKRIGWNDLQKRVLRGTDVVVLGPAAVIPQGAVKLLKGFADDGGKVIVVLSPGLTDVAKSLSNHKIKLGYERLTRGFETVKEPPRDVPFLAPFDKDDWAGFTKLRFRSFALVKGVPAKSVLLRFTNDYPFIWMEPHARGSIVFACIDPRPEAGELVLSAYFLPLIQQLILAAGELYEGRRSFLVGDEIICKGPAATVMCRMPDGTSLKPEPISANDEPALTSAAETEWLQEGNELYRIAPAETPGYITIYAGEDTMDVLAVNCDARAEGDCRPMSIDEVAEKLGLKDYKIIEEEDDIEHVVSVSREGVELSRFFLLAALFALVLEVVVAQRERGGE